MERTVIVLDCKDVSKNICSTVELDLTGKTKQKTNSKVPAGPPMDKPLFRIEKTGLTSCIEGIQEYIRIAYDLFPDEAQIGVWTAREKALRHNTWHSSNQSLQKVMESFVGIVPRPSSNSLVGTLEAAARSLKEKEVSSIDKESSTSGEHYSNPRSTTSRNKIILIIQDTKSTLTEDFSVTLPDSLNQEQRVLELDTSLNNALQSNSDAWSSVLEAVEFTLIKVVNNNSIQTNTIPNTTFTPILTKSCGIVKGRLYVVSAGSVGMLMQQLVISHYRLHSAQVIGIPMKEKDAGEASRGIYDVTLLYSAQCEQTSSTPYLQPFTNNTVTENRIVAPTELKSAVSPSGHPSQLILKWKSIDRKTNADRLLSVCVHRVTALDITSSPTQCLFKHLLSGKPVTLVTVPGEKDGVVMVGALSHLLLSHGEDIYLHCLHQTQLSLQQFPVENYNHSINNLRTKDFSSSIIETNLLRLGRCNDPSYQIQLHKGNGSWSSNHLNTLTAYFPYSDDDTMLFASDQTKDLKTLVDPVKKYMMQPQMDEDEVETSVALITRLFQCCAQNESRLFPVSMADKPGARAEAYQKLWIELYKFAKLYAVSSGQQKVVYAMERLWPEAAKDGGIDSETRPILLSPKAPKTPAGLYTNLTTKLDDTHPGDIWSQYDAASKEADVMQWKQSDETQRPVVELKLNEKQQELKRKYEFESELENYNHQSLFYQYWKCNKKTVVEFDGRLVD